MIGYNQVDDFLKQVKYYINKLQIDHKVKEAS